MVKQMRDPAFKAEQFAGVHLPHVTAVNRLVESLREPEPSAGRGWVPYVAPLHGGSAAKVLSILRDPGPMTHETKGSGMLCVENDDDSGALQCQLLASVELTPADLTPWNAYPWYRHDQSSGLRSPQITEGLDPLTRLISVMPNLRVVLLQGGEAQTLWKRFARRHPGVMPGMQPSRPTIPEGRRSGILIRQSAKPGPTAASRRSARSVRFWTAAKAAAR